ncbi:MAG TPA: hypothetical protein PKL79_08235 [Rectinema sp.]|mgnify:CR=1 FL=1|nr:hypothetical protein [Rectinema sp.]
MNCYQAIFKVQGLLKIPIVSDTLWGHVAWGIALEEGDEFLEAFLHEYNTSPPLVLSNGFPSGYLPKPQFQSPPLDYDNIKDLMAATYLPRELFKEPLGWHTINAFMDSSDFKSALMATEARMRNAIDRYSSTVEGEKLWSEAGLYWYEASNEKAKKMRIDTFDVYCLTSWPKDELGKRIEQALYYGYGGKASIGYGKVALVDIHESELPSQGKRAMALGTFIPAKDEKLQSLAAKIVVRNGKLGPIFAATMNPFKKPLVFYDESTTFDRPKAEYVGELVPNVHPDERICSCGMTLCIAFSEEQQLSSERKEAIHA